MVTNIRKRGDVAEKKAGKFLKKRGFKIVAKNYQNKYGEIDLICKRGVCVHFVAVLPISINKFLYLSSTVFGYMGILLFIMRTMNRLGANKVFYWWIALVLYMTILGIILSRGAWKSSNSLSWFISQDLRYVMYTAIGFALANKAFIKEYHKIMKFLGVLSIFFGILAIFVENF